MNKSSQQPIGNPKIKIKYGVIETPELVGKSWDTPEINWYPGHMLKAKKQLAVQIKRVDIVLELRDARIPVSSVNHDFEKIIGAKKRILLFNKTGLADPQVTKDWEVFFKNQNLPFLFVDVLNQRHLQQIIPIARGLMHDKWETFKKKGIRPPSLKLLITGIPNVGKSSLINKLSRRKATEIGPNPGVTKHQEWIKLGKDVELLDTPGILWPKIDNREAGLRLTITGAIKDSIVGTSLLSEFLLNEIKNRSPEDLLTHYKLTEEQLDLVAGELLEAIAVKRGCLKGGGEIDHHRAEDMLLRDFRAGKLGRMSFDMPED